MVHYTYVTRNIKLITTCGHLGDNILFIASRFRSFYTSLMPMYEKRYDIVTCLSAK